MLYLTQGEDDAHTTDAFLEALVVNATVAKRSYAKVVWGSLPVNQQLSTVTLVASASYLLTKVRQAGQNHAFFWEQPYIF